MGLAAIVSGTSSAGGTLLSSGGMRVGSIFVSVALIFLLGYLDLFNSLEVDDLPQRATIVATIVPLIVVFIATVLYQSLQVWV